jgi:hypothetical protein
MLTARVKGHEARCYTNGCGEVLGRWVRNGDTGGTFYEEVWDGLWHFTIPGILVRLGDDNLRYEEPMHRRRARMNGGRSERHPARRRDTTFDQTFGPNKGTERIIFTLPISVCCLKCRWWNDILPDASHPLTSVEARPKMKP